MFGRENNGGLSSYVAINLCIEENLEKTKSWQIKLCPVNQLPNPPKLFTATKFFTAKAFCYVYGRFVITIKFHYNLITSYYFCTCAHLIYFFLITILFSRTSLKGHSEQVVMLYHLKTSRCVYTVYF